MPHPTTQVEAEEARPNTLSVPLRIGLVGQATESKGITPFLALARSFRQSHPDTVRFHLVGNAPAGADMAAFAVLDEKVPTLHIPRTEFVAKLRRLDAITWLRPVIATRVPIVMDLFERYGEIGELCDDVAQMPAVIARLADAPDPARYEHHVANLRRIRASRTPAALAADYRRIIDGGFPGLLAPSAQGVRAVVAAC